MPTGREPSILVRRPQPSLAFRGQIFISLFRSYLDWSRLDASDLLNLLFLPTKPRSAMEFELSPEEVLPETAKYTLRALVLQGSDVPVFKFPNAQVRSDWDEASPTIP